MTTLALVGAQYGSEGKGVIASQLAHLFDAAVRTGGPNAGHSFYYDDTLYKMRQVPCAWVNPNAELLLGAGAVIDPVVLEREADLVKRIVRVDPQAMIIEPAHHKQEQAHGLRESIGSTTEGVGAARIDKIARAGARLAKDYPFTSDYIISDETVVDRLREVVDGGGRIMLEGTQGALLSLHHGQWPYVTSNDTNAAQLAADAGLPPSEVEHTHLVVRTHPIRVAGNSGPTGGQELSWDEFVDSGVVAKPERTTVTNNIRRIFSYSREDLARAVLLNDPCGIWITFGDYVDRDASERHDIDDLMDGPFGNWYRQNIPRNLRLLGVGVGGDRWRVIPTGDACNRYSARHRQRTWALDHDIVKPQPLELPF